MPKACFVATSPVTLATFVLELAKYLHARSSVDVTFICDDDDKFSASLPDYIRYIPVAMKRGVSLSGIVATTKLFRIFRRERFDLVQYCTPNAALYASIAARAAQVPVRLYCQWGIRYVGMRGLTRCVFKQLERATCSLATDIRPASLKNLEFAVREGLYEAGKSRVLGQGGTIGVDLLDYDIAGKAEYRNTIRSRHGIGEEFVFGFVGRFSRDKGANEILQAFRALSRSVPVRLLCVGDIEAGIDGRLLQWAQTRKDVIFTGPISPSEIPAYYAAIDCYVQPSYREGFGMVLQEAAAMGCAIITTDIPGASEVMEDGISCLLAKPRNAASLEKRMRQVMGDSALRDTLGRNARKRVETCFDRRKMLEIQRADHEQLLR